MIENGEYDPNVINNPKTKKQIQILLSRNGKGNKQYQRKSHPIEFTKDLKYCQSLYFEDKASAGEQSTIKDCRSTEEIIKNNESLDEKCGDKSRFEEIENKLEEMFAGIEDEHLTSVPLEKESNDDKLILNEEVNSISEISCMNTPLSNRYNQVVSTSNKSLLPTKAAMKSTVSFLREENEEYEKQTKSSLKKSRVINVKHCSTRKYNFAKNNKKSCVEYKGNKRTNKQKQKINVNTTSMPKYKLKKGRVLFSDNDEDFEEKTQQFREVDNKNRSPFILINANGNITIVNTLMQDEFNEKYTKTKISKPSFFDRKTVKGCHSSTLSNRYDADKADSSWICVFCKNGPHKKGLGDLFGPYIISTNCDEYQSYKDFIEFSQENGKADLAFFTETSNGSTFYNKSVKHFYDTSITSSTYHVLDIPKQSVTHPIPNYSLGMIKISDRSYEVWIHEDCAIWAPNIFIIGSRLTGLEETIWNSTGNNCYYCSKPGAILCCLQRDCKIMAHLPCAREINWLLDEPSYLTLCEKHFQLK